MRLTSARVNARPRSRSALANKSDSSPASPPGVPTAYALSSRRGPLDAPGGFLAGNTLGSYVHLHFASNPDLARNFAASMARAAAAR